MTILNDKDISNLPKHCHCCGKNFTTIPENHKYLGGLDSFSGYYWNCECRSTLFYSQAMVKENMLKQASQKANK